MNIKKGRRQPIDASVKTKRRSIGGVPALFAEKSPDSGPAQPMSGLTTLELCAGAGGQALGYEQAGIDHVGLVELDRHACATLRLNRPGWDVIEGDLNSFDASGFKGVDIVSGGLPCPPFSVAGKQLGKKDERNLFP